MNDWTDPNSWGDLKLSARVRLARAFRILKRTGKLNRADLQRIGEISASQAQLDLGVLQRTTGAVVYDKWAKCYRLKQAAEALPAPGSCRSRPPIRQCGH